MDIIGLHSSIDSGACLIRDGELLCAVNEERFNRKKLYLGWPELSLRHLKELYGVDIRNADVVAYGWQGRQNDFSEYVPRFTKRLIDELKRNPVAASIILRRVETENARDGASRNDFDDKLDAIGVARAKRAYLDHHQSHAWAAFACSPFNEALVLTLDGRGDLRAGLAAVANSRGLQEADYLISAFDGLGFLYGQITHHLGFVPHRHEGKVTGLAAFGDPLKTLPLFERLVTFEDGAIRCRIDPYKPFYTNLAPELSDELNKFSREDIAAGLQVHCEHLVAQWAGHWLRRLDGHGENICLSGGLFANVRINQVVSEIPGVKNVFIFPHMGDGGLTVGAAALALHRKTGQAKLALPTAYLGPEFTDAETVKAIDEFGSRVKAVRVADKAAESADALVDGKVVGFFEGRMEFGPRALGARSILYHTRDRSANDWLNKRMHRSEFMPFAPVSPVEFAAECYKDWEPDHVCAQFMTKTYDCTESFKSRHPAVVHIDGTARPQIVYPQLHGRYYDVVRSYCEKTGERALINTSFNMHEEPIVCSPQDALEALSSDIVDVLMLGDHRVERA